ncbi:MAG: alanine--tRNA ligase [Candidatus Bathyarchaeota archaeon]|nr:alanine--tRNA ligase [Candidatus Bathyarchaeota archaeon]
MAGVVTLWILSSFDQILSMVIDSKKLKKMFLGFFSENQHNLIPNSPLIPEYDPTVLFTPAGMHPLIPYFLGQPHPLGKKLMNVQKCFRTGDIECVGDSSHLTFFEMLGSWSLGDYFKRDAIRLSYEFLTDKRWLNLDEKRLLVTVFAGDQDAPRDLESYEAWSVLGVPDDRIFFLSKAENWWGPIGDTGPCGPCTEMFYDTGKPPCSPSCRPGCLCGKYFELWNDVFMEYNRTSSGVYELLKQKNVDTGMGVEHTAAMLEGKETVFEIAAIRPIAKKIEELASISLPTPVQEKSIRIITDHIRASTFFLGDERGVKPSNVDRGYVLRRLIRRVIRFGRLLGIERDFLTELADIVITLNESDYPLLREKENSIFDELSKEEAKFKRTLEKGLRKFQRIAEKSPRIDGKNAFLLFQSFGFPFELTKELAAEIGVEVDEEEFRNEYERHQQVSSASARRLFKGGLSDASIETERLHTATHLLNEALRRVLKKKDIVQRGSNITPERLRFDFNFDRPLTPEEIDAVEKLVNEQIKKALLVVREEMTVEEAKRRGAQAVFDHKYDNTVSVYKAGDFSTEICGGPHVSNTSELGVFKITKQKGIAAGVRRIRAILEQKKER